jgi:hypothetical protein
MARAAPGTTAGRHGPSQLRGIGVGSGDPGRVVQAGSAGAGPRAARAGREGRAGTAAVRVRAGRASGARLRGTPHRLPERLPAGTGRRTCSARQPAGGTSWRHAGRALRAAVGDRAVRAVEPRGDRQRRHLRPRPRGQMSSPLTAGRACSRLSPHLALGTLSMREAVHAARLRRAELQQQPKELRGSGRGRWPASSRACTGTATSSRSSNPSRPSSSATSTAATTACARRFRRRALPPGRAARPAGPSSMPACGAGADRLAQLPHARDAGGDRLLAAVAALAAAGPASGALLHRLRARHPLQPGADAGRRHRHQHPAHVQPGEAVAGPGPGRATSSAAGARNWRTCRPPGSTSPGRWVLCSRPSTAR